MTPTQLVTHTLSLNFLFLKPTFTAPFFFVICGEGGGGGGGPCVPLMLTADM